MSLCHEEWEKSVSGTIAATSEAMGERDASTSIINEFHRVKKRSFITAVVNRSQHIYLSGFVLLQTDHLQKKTKWARKNALLLSSWARYKQNTRTHLLRARVVFKNCYNTRDYRVFSGFFWFVCVFVLSCFILLCFKEKVGREERRGKEREIDWLIFLPPKAREWTVWLHISVT